MTYIRIHNNIRSHVIVSVPGAKFCFVWSRFLYYWLRCNCTVQYVVELCIQQWVFAVPLCCLWPFVLLESSHK